MKNVFGIAALMGIGSMLTGCAGMAFTPNGAPSGSIYMGAQTAHIATANPLGGKRGDACAMSILGIVTIGDASAATAARAGGITKISTVDNDSMNVLGIYAKHCSVVTGD